MKKGRKYKKLNPAVILKTSENMRIIREELLPILHEIYCRAEMRKYKEKEDKAFNNENLH